MNKHLPVLIALLMFGSFGVVGDDITKYDTYLTCTDNYHLRINSKTYEGEYHHKVLNIVNFGWSSLYDRQEQESIEVNDTYIIWRNLHESGFILDRTNLNFKTIGPKIGNLEQFTSSYQCRKSSKIEVENLIKDFDSKLKDSQQI